MAALNFTEKDLQTDAWQERGLPKVWKTSDASYFKNPASHPVLFGTFDCRFFGTHWKESQCIFTTRDGSRYPMIGREANYYFQGLVFKAFDQDASYMTNYIFRWKQSYAVIGPVTGEASALHIPSQNDIFMAVLGHWDYNWYDAHRNSPESVKLGPIARQRTLAQIWDEARKYRASGLYSWTGETAEIERYNK